MPVPAFLYWLVDWGREGGLMYKQGTVAHKYLLEFKYYLSGAEVVPEFGQVLSELVPILRF